MADAPRSGRGEGSLMWVQVPPSAHETRKECGSFCLANIPYPLSLDLLETDKGGGFATVDRGHQWYNSE